LKSPGVDKVPKPAVLPNRPRGKRSNGKMWFGSVLKYGQLGDLKKDDDFSRRT